MRARRFDELSPPCGGYPGQRELDLDPRGLFQEEDPHLPLPRRLGVEVRFQVVMREEPASTSVDAEAVDLTHGSGAALRG